MHIMLTVCSGLILIACAALWWLAQQRAERAERAYNRLHGAIARIAALEGEVDSLRRQLQKLRGTFYATRAEETEAAAEVAERQVDIEDAVLGPVCDNWLQAKIDGPRSRAANCECGYCEAARAQRAQFRAQALPRRATVRAVKGTE